MDTIRSLTALNTLIKTAEPMVPGSTRAVLGEGPLLALALVGGKQVFHVTLPSGLGLSAPPASCWTGR